MSKNFLVQVTVEDGIYQYLGALLFLLAAIAFFVSATRRKLYRFENKNEKYTERFCFFYFWRRN